MAYTIFGSSQVGMTHGPSSCSNFTLASGRIKLWNWQFPCISRDYTILGSFQVSMTPQTQQGLLKMGGNGGLCTLWKTTFWLPLAVNAARGLVEDILALSLPKLLMQFWNSCSLGRTCHTVEVSGLAISESILYAIVLDLFRKEQRQLLSMFTCQKVWKLSICIDR